VDFGNIPCTLAWSAFLFASAPHQWWHHADLPQAPGDWVEVANKIHRLNKANVITNKDLGPSWLFFLPFLSWRDCQLVVCLGGSPCAGEQEPFPGKIIGLLATDHRLQSPGNRKPMVVNMFLHTTGPFVWVLVWRGLAQIAFCLNYLPVTFWAKHCGGQWCFIACSLQHAPFTTISNVCLLEGMMNGWSVELAAELGAR